jgi:hypothetical protein
MRSGTPVSVDRLDTGIDAGSTDLGVLRPARNHTPLGPKEFSLLTVADADDVLSGSDVVSWPPFVFELSHDIEDLGEVDGVR